MNDDMKFEDMVTETPKYLGETEYDVKDTPYADYGLVEWVLDSVNWGQFDGSHHKQWALDQAARAANGGVPSSFKLAKWSDGQEEWRLGDMTKTPKYEKWVIGMKDGEDGPNTYDYDEGIAP